MVSLILRTFLIRFALCKSKAMSVVEVQKGLIVSSLVVSSLFFAPASFSSENSSCCRTLAWMATESRQEVFKNGLISKLQPPGEIEVDDTKEAMDDHDSC